jgi:hypothetical protein
MSGCEGWAGARNGSRGRSRDAKLARPGSRVVAAGVFAAAFLSLFLVSFSAFAAYDPIGVWPTRVDALAACKVENNGFTCSSFKNVNGMTCFYRSANVSFCEAECSTRDAVEVNGMCECIDGSSPLDHEGSMCPPPPSNCPAPFDYVPMPDNGICPDDCQSQNQAWRESNGIAECYTPDCPVGEHYDGQLGCIPDRDECASISGPTVCPVGTELIVDRVQCVRRCRASDAPPPDPVPPQPVPPPGTTPPPPEPVTPPPGTTPPPPEPVTPPPGTTPPPPEPVPPPGTTPPPPGPVTPPPGTTPPAPQPPPPYTPPPQPPVTPPEPTLPPGGTTPPEPVPPVDPPPQPVEGTCPAGFTLIGNECVGTLSCPDGWTLVGNECVGTLSCPEGWIKVGDTCEWGVLGECPPGSYLADDLETCIYDAECLPGYELIDGVCIAPPSCPDGWTLYEGECVAGLQCPEGWTLDGQECVPAMQCPDGWELDGDECVPGLQCPDGWELDGDECVPGLQCPDGWELDGDECVPAMQCPDGWELLDGQCIPPEDEEDCEPGQVFVDGICQNPEVCPAGTTRDPLRGECIPIIGTPGGAVPTERLWVPGEAVTISIVPELSDWCVEPPCVKPVETLQSAMDMLKTGWLAPYLNLDLSIPAGSCPVMTWELGDWGGTVVIDSHCIAFDALAPFLTAFAIFLYALRFALTVLSA